MNFSGKRILCVGLACLDIVHICKSYPTEDSDQRCLSYRWQCGGNAANNCCVLAQLGENCELFTTLSNQHTGRFIIEDLKSYDISIDNCVYYDCEAPLSTIIINDANGSRTILHYNKNLPELELKDFEKLDLSQYSWIHFEGRNVAAVSAMIDQIIQWNDRNPVHNICVSLELEKHRPELLQIVSKADVVFVGKDFAKFLGHFSKADALQAISAHTKPSASIIVPWGEEGAVARGPDLASVHCPAFPPERVVDTLGAGDTFCAAVIHGLHRGHNLAESVEIGCRLAGAKVGMPGYRGLDIEYDRIKCHIIPISCDNFVCASHG